MATTHRAPRPAALLMGLLVGLAAAAQAGPAAATEFGVYRGPGCDGRARIPEFERFVGRRVERTVDALAQDTWPSLESSVDWIIGCWKDSGIKLTLSVPMLTRDGTSGFAEGAAGSRDATFARVGRSLVANGQPDAIVRIGWEFNGDWMPWAAEKDPDGFVAYFRRIVQVMRETPGQRFRFEWCPNHRRHRVDPDRAYPGDDVVDVIGMDIYDEVWNAEAADPVRRWAWYVEQPYGLRWHRDFARAHGKPTAYSEWGTGTKPDGHGAGDSPVFIAGMADWIAESGPLYQSYWDNPSPEFNTQLSNGQFPKSAAVFVARFGESAERGSPPAAPALRPGSPRP